MGFVGDQEGYVEVEMGLVGEQIGDGWADTEIDGQQIGMDRQMLNKLGNKYEISRQLWGSFRKR